MRSFVRRPLAASALAVAVTTALVYGATAAVTPNPVPSDSLNSVAVEGSLTPATQPESDWAEAQAGGQLAYVIDKEKYQIGYTAQLDMTQTVRAWNLLKEQSIAEGIKQTEAAKDSLNYAINRYNGSRYSAFLGRQTPVDWNAPDNTAALSTLRWLRNMGPLAANLVPEQYREIYNRFLKDAGFFQSLASRADAATYWNAKFDASKLASELEVSFKVDPAKVQVDNAVLNDLDAWKQAYADANTSTAAQAYTRLMQLYAVDYVAEGENKTLKDGSAAEPGTVVMKFRLQDGDATREYESVEDYELAVTTAKAIRRPATAATHTAAAEAYAANTSRTVQASAFNTLLNGADGNKAYSDAAWTQPENADDELSAIKVATPRGFLTVTEETARSLDWRTSADTATIDASNLKVIGDMRMPIADEADLQSILVEKNGSNGTLPYTFSSGEIVKYMNENPAGISYDFKAVLADGSADSRTLPAEVTALKPEAHTVSTFDELTNAEPKKPTQTKVAVEGGEWHFVKYLPLTEAKWTTHKAADIPDEEEYPADMTAAKYAKAVGEWVFKAFVTPTEPTLNPAECGVRKTVAVPAEDDNFTYAEAADGDTIRVTATPKPGVAAQKAEYTWDFNVAADPCPVEVEIPAQPEVTDPCGAGNAEWVKPSDTEQIAWTLTADKHLVAATKEGFTFPGKKTEHDYGVAPEANTDPCVVSVDIPATPDVNAVCGVDNDTWNQPEDTDQIMWSINQDKFLIATTKPGFQFTDGTTSHNYGVAPEGNTDPCPPSVVVPEEPTYVDTPCGQRRDVGIPGGNDKYTYHVRYEDNDGLHMVVTATAAEGYVFPDNQKTKVWEFDRTPTPCPPQVVEYVEPTLEKQPCAVRDIVTVAPDTEQVKYTKEINGNTVTVTATAAEGYVFAGGEKTKTWTFEKECGVSSLNPLVVDLPVYKLPGTTWNPILIPGEKPTPGTSPEKPVEKEETTTQKPNESTSAVVSLPVKKTSTAKVALAKTGANAAGIAGLAALIALVGAAVLYSRKKNG